jgi:hypothetical protein
VPHRHISFTTNLPRLFSIFSLLPLYSIEKNTATMKISLAILTASIMLESVYADGPSTCAHAWGSKKHCHMAVAICLAESGGNPHATNVNSDSHHSVDRGLWQINNYWHSEVSDTCAFSASCNAKAAKRISSDGSNWTPWATYNGGAYKRHMSEAQAACSRRYQIPASLPHDHLNLNSMVDNILSNDSEDADRDYQELDQELEHSFSPQSCQSRDSVVKRGLKAAHGSYVQAVCGHMGPYRCDCSGFVSYTWKLTSANGGPVTQQFHNYCSRLGSWKELKPGDAILKPQQHVLLFVKWSGDGHNSFVEAACHDPEEGCNHQTSTISYYQANGFYPCRAHNKYVCPAKQTFLEQLLQEINN